MDRSTDDQLAEREATLRRAIAAGERRERLDPSLRETEEIRGRAILALVAGGMNRDHAIAVADKITRRRVEQDDPGAYKRFQAHRLHEHRSSLTRRANGVDLGPTPAT